MATITGGTTAQTTLTGLKFAPGVMLPADVATIAQLISSGTAFTGGSVGKVAAFSQNGTLFIGSRGVLRLQPGDYVFISPTTGWPILLDTLTAASAGWVHT